MDKLANAKAISSDMVFGGQDRSEVLCFVFIIVLQFAMCTVHVTARHGVIAIDYCVFSRGLEPQQDRSINSCIRLKKFVIVS